MVTTLWTSSRVTVWPLPLVTVVPSMVMLAPESLAVGVTVASVTPFATPTAYSVVAASKPVVMSVGADGQAAEGGVGALGEGRGDRAEQDEPDPDRQHPPRPAGLTHASRGGWRDADKRPLKRGRQTKRSGCVHEESFALLTCKRLSIRHPVAHDPSRITRFQKKMPSGAKKLPPGLLRAGRRGEGEI